MNTSEPSESYINMGSRCPTLMKWVQYINEVEAQMHPRDRIGNIYIPLDEWFAMCDEVAWVTNGSAFIVDHIMDYPVCPAVVCEDPDNHYE